jgi:heptose-I-phosphate ethanolaminephosphotransferase
VIACYTLILLPPFVAELWRGYSGVYYLYDSRNNYIVNTALIIALLSIGLACLTQYAGRLQRIVFISLLLSLTLLGGFALTHVFLYDAPISVGAVDAILGTDLHEAVEYLDFHWNLTLTLVAAGYWMLFLVTLILAWPRLRQHRLCPLSHALAWSTLLLLVIVAYQFPAVASYHHDVLHQRSFLARAGELNHQVPSIRILYDIGEWLEYRRWLEETQKARATQGYGVVPNKALKSRTMVLVIGESLRRDRMSLYGYRRPTTPLLDKRRKQLLVFEKAISPSNQTVPSLTKMLTPATVEQPDLFLTEPSILVAAKQAGYHTYWLSNQGRVGHFDSMISLIANDADTKIFTNTEFYGSVYDAELLHPLEVALRDPHPHKFIIMHTLGSHQSYRNRYPPEKNYFRPEAYAGESPDEEQATVQSEYDNSVRYTDFFLEEILRKLEKQTGSLMLFASDHGERIYDNDTGTCGHAFPDPIRIEFDVPFFLWCSGSCPRRWQRAQAKYHALPFNTENLFHTAADLLGLNMTEYRAQDDILNPKYRPVRQPQIIDVNRGVHTYVSLP